MDAQARCVDPPLFYESTERGRFLGTYLLVGTNMTKGKPSVGLSARSSQKQLGACTHPSVALLWQHGLATMLRTCRAVAARL